MREDWADQDFLKRRRNPRRRDLSGLWVMLGLAVIQAVLWALELLWGGVWQ